ncbi:hypothetical protein [Cytobacillus oceanisediminis]|uniref:hypothetical protein n=1 Tax=Cytobacillus oceanisediminis TaxID=665099 RepID=UPI00203DF448|nr:hypothetical protein [Cytobacillus oceanisediminis]MCM3402958.1 hypothetical protein [Cytobacillus oceanisediminis]
MTLVKVEEDIVTVISREENHFTVITREREVKRVPAIEVNAVKNADIQKTLKDIRTEKVIYLPEYRKIKNFFKT